MLYISVAAPGSRTGNQENCGKIRKKKLEQEPGTADAVISAGRVRPASRTRGALHCIKHMNHRFDR